MANLRWACLAVRTVTSLMKTKTLKLVYIAYFHSITSRGIIFGRNSTDSKKVFHIQKRIIRVMADTKREPLVGTYLRSLISSEFLLPSPSCVVDNMKNFNFKLIHISTVWDTDITFIFQILTPANINKEYTILELSYSINFHLSKVQIMI
jgi:hypothetical protein